jgi:hypothetical protein
VIWMLAINAGARMRPSAGEKDGDNWITISHTHIYIIYIYIHTHICVYISKEVLKSELRCAENIYPQLLKVSGTSPYRVHRARV